MSVVATLGRSARLVTDPREIDDLCPEWSELLARSGCDVPFLSPEWLRPWWRQFGPRDGRRAALFTLREGGRLVALAPLLTRTHWYRPGLPFRRLELWGSGECEADAICSDYLNLIAEAGRESHAAGAFAAELAGRPWDEFVVPLMDGTGPMPNLLAQAFRARGFAADVTATTEAPYIALPATWDGYLAGLDRDSRYLIRRSLKDFEAWAGGAWKWHEAGTEPEVEEGARILRRLHGERWEGAGGGTFRSPRFLAFHAEAMRNLLDAGALHLVWVTVRGEPVAAMYDLRWQGKVYFYQCGRKLDVPKGVRPGGVIVALAIKKAIEEGCREFDFLGGAAVYKRQLARASRPLVELRVVRPGWRERVRGALEWGKAVARRWRKGRTPPEPAQ
ncbi:MAG: GNAT family N-acetyltransferase [Gemmataceae bacterium]